jgi:hybrid polyketide synthase/nonribosomal peptide synthetase FtdB
MTIRSPNVPLREKIAIVGIGCRLPGAASDHRAYWRNLLDGKDCITETPPDRYDVNSLRSRNKAKPGHLVGGKGGYIDGFDEFDPEFFGISPREAEQMDPQQRKLLEVAWEALEDAGQKPGQLAGRDIGVFVGAFTLDYKTLQFCDLSFENLTAHTATGSMMTILSNRISYCFDFRGPSMSIDTACSSSLVAVHLACESLRRGESSLALAGGTLLHMAPQYTIAETKGGFLSPEGRSRTFDESANGYVRAEGVALVALKRLSDALRDGDPIHAVIAASGVNQDGRTNGITVPNPDAQVELITRVCAEAGITPGDLQYMEAHGTSTPTGDPIEANALGRALAIGRKPGAPCYVGSVKTNIGHTEAAAGIAGLIKTALSVKHRLIPPHINLRSINPAIDLPALPYDIPTQVTPWPDHEGPALAAVNSFGFGGTNAHVVLEQPPHPTAHAAGLDDAGTRGCTILPLTSRSPAVLPEMARRIRDELAGQHGDPPALSDIAWTLSTRREHLDTRLSVVYSSADELDEALAAYQRGESHPRVLVDQVRDTAAQGPVWVFTGMGPQWWAMGRQLYRENAVYRAAVDRCDREIRMRAGWSLVEELMADETTSRMSETWLAQPANFAVQVGLAAMWRANGVHCAAIVGHSTGEVAAFYEAGVYTLEEAVKIVLHRSRLQQRLVDTGGMVAAGLSHAEAERRLQRFAGRLSVAAVNSPSGVTLAGDREVITEVTDELAAAEVFVKQLAVRVPYHSAVMDAIKEELLSALAGLKPRTPRVPLYLTGVDTPSEQVMLDADYWWHNVRDTVLFRAAVDRMIEDGHRVFLEIGPHPVLSHSIQECAATHEVEVVTVPSIRREEDEIGRFTLSLAALHNIGVQIDWEALHPAGSLVPLPTYPWRRDRYWVEPAGMQQIRLGQVDHRLLGRRLTAADPTWEVRLDVERFPYLSDHRIQGNVVFPAAGYLEMAAQAGRALTGGTDVVLTDIELRKALFLHDDAATTVQLGISTDDASFRVTSLDGGTEPVVHATGVVRARPGGLTVPALVMDEVRDRMPQHLGRESCYSALAARGYEYGSAFRPIEEVWVGANEALARIRPVAGLGADAVEHHMHPTVLDACFQSLLTPLVVEAADTGTGVRLPLSIDEVSLCPIGDQPIWAHAVVRHRDDDEMAGDIDIYDDTGVLLGRVGGFRAGNVEKARAGVGIGTIDGWLKELTWVEQTEEAVERHTPDEPATDTAGNWLLLADSQGFAGELATQISARGGRCHLARPGSAYDVAADGTSVLVPGRSEDLRRLFARLRDDGWTGRIEVMHLWNLDLPKIDELPSAELDDWSNLGSYSLVAVAQALAPGDLDARLHIVTQGTQRVTVGDCPEPLGASAWGVGRVLWQQELTAHRGTLVDLETGDHTDGTSRHAEAAMLLTHAASGKAEELAFRGGRAYVSRLASADLPRPLPMRLRADGAYLVTGAFGALGQLLCRTLVRRGARRLILVGRTTVPPRSSWSTLGPDDPAGRHVRFVRELEELGAEATVVRLDVTDESSLVAWLEERHRQQLPPIRGVFHLAGRVEDRLVAEMDRAVFDATYTPKVAGAHLLHRHLGTEPLDHFVLFSSVASLLTTSGQTNYAAGNAFLDALAHHRRARGMTALSLDWGPWAIGMIQELGLVDHYRNSRGMSSLSPDAGMAVLERIIDQDRAQLLVATVVDWPTFLSWYPDPPALVTDLARSADTSMAETSDFTETFRRADDTERHELVRERFTALVAGILHVTADRVEPTTTLTKLGLDSLLAMELRARVMTELGVAVPVVALLGNSTMAELVNQLHDLVAEAVGADTGGEVLAEVEVFTDQSAYPLTENQKALWFLKQLHPDGFAYNIGGAVEIRTELDPELMLAAVRVLLERHPILRANYVLHEGRPVQVISPEIKEDMAVIDVSDRSWDEIYRMIIEEYRKPYDLEHDPLVRFRLFRRADDHWAIMKAAHHIVSDAISTFTFIDELLAVYEGMRSGETVELPPVPATYLDFLNWQRRLLAGRAAPRMLEYWRSHLPAEVPNLTLPTDKPRPPVQTNNGASELFVLDERLSGRVLSKAREYGVTPFMVLLAAYYLLLNRYSGQDDVIVGSPVSGRTQEAFSSVYGYFVNPLPLHVNLSGEPTVAQLIDRVRTAVLGGLDNQEYPFVLLVEKLGLQHDPSRSAVFQAMFILLTHNVSTDKYGYRLEYIDLPEEEGQFDLTLSAYEDTSENRFHCVFKYNTDLFQPETVRRLASHYINLVDALTRAPAERAVTELEMLGTDERRALLGEWSRTPELTSGDAPVHELIARAAADHPDAVAASVPSACGDSERMTYGELERRSAAVATRLRARGVGQGSVVAVCLEKSADLVAILLGVLRSGAAYLPLDPEYPAERLAFMLQQAAARLVVVNRDGDTGGIARGTEATILVAEELQLPLTGPAAHVAVNGDSPAYVIFTSGSSGQPKAVEVSHANLSSAYRAWEDAYGLLDDVRVHLQMANPSFDVFTGDLVRALCSGGTLVLVGRELLFNTARLHTVIREEAVDCGEFVPAVVRSLSAHCERTGAALGTMRLVVVGSDLWKVEEYQRLRDICGPSTRVVNSYGLTEATIDSAFFEGTVDGLDPKQTVPIGRPLSNSILLILDPYGRPVPPGVSGELHIGGAGVAAGYVGDPEQTQERFIVRKLDGEQLRLYRTGDLAKWDSTGRIHLLGRVDRQLKVRGHRIEVGEIEARLTDWPGVDQAVVTVRQDHQGDDVLCAYCVAAGSELDWREIRHHLAEYLPTFMIPSSFVQVEALTLSQNGKVDLAALPAPRSLDGHETAEPPSTLFEVRMAALWSTLLGVEHVGLQHDFFELGGTSIKLMELIHHLQSEFSVDVAVSELFKLTTLRGMSKTVENAVAGKTSGSAPYLVMNAGDGTNLFCFPPAGGHGLVYRELATHLDQQVVAFNYIGGEDMVERYADLVESIQPAGTCALLGYSLGGNVAFEVAQELERRSREVSGVVIFDSYRITEQIELADEHLTEFEQELRGHVRRHTNIEEVAQETLEQAKEYIRSCYRRVSHGNVAAAVTVIAEEGSESRYAPGMPGSWHGSSATECVVLSGHGAHAAMLDRAHAAFNASQAQDALTGSVTDAA